MTTVQFFFIMLQLALVAMSIGIVSNHLRDVSNSLKQIEFHFLRLREEISDNNHTILAQIRDKMK